jgi:hypothetical protein
VATMSDFPEYVCKLMAASNAVLLTGSKYICPSQEHNDIDIMLLVDDIEQFEQQHQLDNKCGDSYPDDDMISFRYGVYNILLTEEPGYFRKWKLATEIATKLNLIHKEDRKYLFQQLVDDNSIIVDIKQPEIIDARLNKRATI